MHREGAHTNHNRLLIHTMGQQLQQSTAWILGQHPAQRLPGLCGPNSVARHRFCKHNSSHHITVTRQSTLTALASHQAQSAHVAAFFDAKTHSNPKDPTMPSKKLTLLRTLTSAVAMVLLGATASTAVMTVSAHAAAPMVKKSAPGYYRMMLGDFEVTALLDGTVELPVNKILTNIKAGKVDAALAKYSLSSPLETSVNAYLINTGTKLVLIDTGAAKLFGPTLGNLLESLKSAGYTPEQVDEIYITHMHADHVGGLMAGDKLAFPNAIVRSEKQDADFWLSKENMDKAPEAMKGFFQGAQASLNPYVSAGKYKPFEGNSDLLPGIKAVVTRGHTPGHTIYMVESKGQKMAVLGDLMHVAAVQFPQPSVAIQFDVDSKTAITMRSNLYATAAKEKFLLAVAHVSFPGIGRVRKDGTGYAWMPVNYTVVK